MIVITRLAPSQPSVGAARADSADASRQRLISLHLHIGGELSRFGCEAASDKGMRPFVRKAALGILLIGGPALFAQSAGQDMKQAGRDVKSAGQATGEAAKDTGSAVGKTAKKTGRKVKHTSKRAAHKAAAATENGAAKVKEKTDK
jgi:hypothetical protein